MPTFTTNSTIVPPVSIPNYNQAVTATGIGRLSTRDMGTWHDELAAHTHYIYNAGAGNIQLAGQPFSTEPINPTPPPMYRPLHDGVYVSNIDQIFNIPSSDPQELEAEEEMTQDEFNTRSVTAQVTYLRRWKREAAYEAQKMQRIDMRNLGHSNLSRLNPWYVVDNLLVTSNVLGCV